MFPPEGIGACFRVETEGAFGALHVVVVLFVTLVCTRMNAVKAATR